MKFWNLIACYTVSPACEIKSCMLYHTIMDVVISYNHGCKVLSYIVKFDHIYKSLIIHPCIKIFIIEVLSNMKFQSHIHWHIWVCNWKWTHEFQLRTRVYRVGIYHFIHEWILERYLSVYMKICSGYLKKNLYPGQSWIADGSKYTMLMDESQAKLECNVEL